MAAAARFAAAGFIAFFGVGFLDAARRGGAEFEVMKLVLVLLTTARGGSPIAPKAWRAGSAIIMKNIFISMSMSSLGKVNGLHERRQDCCVALLR